MIKVTDNNRVVKECTAKYEHTVNGKPEVVDIRVLFYPPTLAEIKGTDPASVARKAGKTKKSDLAPSGQPWISLILSERLHSLPDLADANGKPFAITPENLDRLTLDNLRSIEKAILEGSVPKSEPSN